MEIKHILLSLLLLGCSPSIKPTIRLEESKDARVILFTQHWSTVRHVRVYTVPGLKVPYRDLVAGIAYLREDLGGLEWEIPLCAQNVLDPITWTWGSWGPFYSGQSIQGKLLTQ